MCAFLQVERLKDSEICLTGTHSVMDIVTTLLRMRFCPLCQEETNNAQTFISPLLSRMDSFFLAEMFKYLYLLFTDKEDLTFDIEDYIFTTEAHLLPLWLSTANQTAPKKNIVSTGLQSQLIELQFWIHLVKCVFLSCNVIQRITGVTMYRYGLLYVLHCELE